MTTEVKRAICSEAFNKMPLEYRVIASNSEIFARIQDLERLKNRLKENYDREITFINSQIKNYEHSIKF